MAMVGVKQYKAHTLQRKKWVNWHARSTFHYQVGPNSITKSNIVTKLMLEVNPPSIGQLRSREVHWSKKNFATQLATECFRSPFVWWWKIFDCRRLGDHFIPLLIVWRLSFSRLLHDWQSKKLVVARLVIVFFQLLQGLWLLKQV